MKPKVVVTGLGVINSLGFDIETLWNNLLEGKSGIQKITKFDATAFSTQIGGEITTFNPEDYMDPKDAKKTDLFIQYAIAASSIAVRDAGLDRVKPVSERFGVYIGSGIGGISEIARQQMVLIEKGPRRISPFFIPNAIANLASGHVSIMWSAKGPNSSVCTACATGAHAIGDSFEIIRRGDADVMIAGGAEAPIMPLALAGFCALRALSTRNDDPQTASRPFDLHRDGFVMGEGAASIILESEAHALERGARIYCEVVGYGMSGDAYHLTAPSPDGDGAARCMTSAIKCAGITPAQINYINAHGTSTPLNDKFETLAIKRVFGDLAYKIPINSTKSMVGHLLGAAGALEFSVVAKSILTGKIHKTANYQTPDPECDLDYVVDANRDINVDFALSNSFGFGGTNATLIAKKYVRES